MHASSSNSRFGRGQRRLRRLVMLFVLVAAAIGHPATPVAALTYTCTEAGLDSALANGGIANFDCAIATTIAISGQKIITRNLNIIGNSLNGTNLLTISGRDTHTIFLVDVGKTLTLRNLTLTRGFAMSGAAINAAERSVLHVTNTTFSSNAATHYGGAIYTLGSLSVTNSRFQSNTAGGAGGAIDAPPGGTPGSPTFAISGSMFTGNRVTGAGPGGAVRAGDGTTPMTVTIANTTFENNTSSEGGGLYVNVGDEGKATIRDSTFKGNRAFVGGWIPGGGALNVSGTYDIQRSVFSGNTAPDNTGGAIYHLRGNGTISDTTFTANSAGNGGAIGHADGVLGVQRSDFSMNMATILGGAIWLSSPGFTLTDSSITGNSAQQFGGGIALWTWGAVSTIRNTTISGNRTTGLDAPPDSGGGAIYNLGTMTIVQSTISGNEARVSTSGNGGVGGGIYNQNQMSVMQTTINGNSAAWAERGGNIFGNNGLLTLKHHLVAGGKPENCTEFRGFGGMPVIQSLGYNAFESKCGENHKEDRWGKADLGALQNNGGRTLTHMPQARSQAINVGEPCVAGAKDQRGMDRTHSGRCDAGAVESSLAPPVIVQHHSAPSSPSGHLPQQEKAKVLAQAGDPVNLIFGNFTYEHTDLDVPSVGPDVQIRRSYNSAIPHDGLLGYGWHLAYDLRVISATVDLVEVKRGDGRVDGYTVEDDGRLTPPSGSEDRLVRNSDGTYVLTTRDDLTYRFSSVGRLLSVADLDGNLVRLSYTSGRWSSITDAGGRIWSLAYTAAGRISSVRDPAGRVVRYAYSAAGDLTSVTNPAGGVTRYTYDANHRLTRITDANGHLFVAHVYDANGKVVQQTDSRGIHRFAYADGSTVYSDTLGIASRIEYDDQFRITRRVDGLGNATALTYDERGLVLSETNPNGGITRYAYDGRGNTVAMTDTLRRVTRMTYDARDNLLTRRDALGRVTSHAYDSRDHLINTTDALRKITRYSYDGRGLQTSMTDANGGVTSFGYDAFGNQTVVTNTLKGVTRFGYDSASRTINQTDVLGRVSRTTYNPLSLVLTETAADGGVTRYTYDAAGNLLGVTDPLSRTTRYAYNSANDRISMTGPLGQVTSYTYDGMGRRITETLPDGKVWQTTYDAVGRVIRTTSPLLLTTVITYDRAGNVLSETNALGKVTRFAYDAAHQLQTVTDPLGGVTRYTYDTAGNRVTATDPLNHRTSFLYDALNRKVRETNALGHMERWSYDALGRLTSTTNGNGQVVSFGYDQLGRRVTEQADGFTTRFSYDAAGNRLGMIDRDGTTSYTYDAMNRVLSISGPRGLVRYSYDRVGNRLTMSQPGGLVLSYSYDAHDRVASVKQGTSSQVAYTYDSAGRLVEERFGNGVATVRSYDGDGRLIGLDTTRGTTRLNSISYALDALGNRTAETGTGFNATYQYDGLGRLTLGKLTVGSNPAKAYQYSYDAAGNRVRETIGGAATVYTYDAANRMTMAGTRSVVYDAAGRLTNDGTTSYSYNSLGRLVGTNGTANVRYGYDGDGNRVRDVVNGVTTTLLLDVERDLPVRIAAMTGASSERYVYGAGMQRVVQYMPNGAPQYEHADGLGSVRVLTGSTGAITGRTSYAPFGERLAGSGTFGFTGEPQSAANGLVHLRARDYSPPLGRFLTPDPHAPEPIQPQTLNLYTYVMNNPVNATDPSGEICILWIFGKCGSENDQARARRQEAARRAEQARRQAEAAAQRAEQARQAEIARQAAELQKQLAAPIIANGGGNLVGLNGSNVVAKPDGNNIVGTNSGAIIANGGGNVVANGGGNVVANRGGTYGLLHVTESSAGGSSGGGGSSAGR